MIEKAEGKASPPLGHQGNQATRDFRHIAAGTILPARAGDPDIRILRRVSPPDAFPLAAEPVGDAIRVGIVDTETTGIDLLAIRQSAPACKGRGRRPMSRAAS